MQVPLEISFREIEKNEALEALINDEAAKLEKICDYLISCRIAVEKPHEHQRSGSPYRVRIKVTLPPGHEIVAVRESGESDMHEPLHTVLRNAFEAVQRQLKKVTAQQRGEVKTHLQQEMAAVVYKLAREEGYGFLKTLDGREIYFHRNSVLNDDFDRLEIGTGVRFFEEEGEKGAQASSVQIVDKPGVRVSESGQSASEPPLGWKP